MSLQSLLVFAAQLATFLKLNNCIFEPMELIAEISRFTLSKLIFIIVCKALLYLYPMIRLNLEKNINFGLDQKIFF